MLNKKIKVSKRKKDGKAVIEFQWTPVKGFHLFRGAYLSETPLKYFLKAMVNSYAFVCSMYDDYGKGLNSKYHASKLMNYYKKMDKKQLEKFCGYKKEILKVFAKNPLTSEEANNILNENTLNP